MATKRSASFIRVACRLPHGLKLRLPDGRELVLHGLHSPYAVAEHGMTDVALEDWALIEATYGGEKWMKNDFVFALDADSARDKATERKEVNAGFNPIDPRRPSTTRGASMIQPDGAKDPAGE